LGNLAVFAGGFGSGKSEIAVNFALDIASKANNTVLADLDLVNPFFASRDAREKLAGKKVRLIAPGGGLAFDDIPNLPTEIIAIMKQDNELLIDLPGDEVGALIMGYLSKFVTERSSFDFYLVINPYRPFANEWESLLSLKELFEKASLLKFTGIISNPNMVEETNLEVVLNGHQKVVKLASCLGLPIKYLTVEERLAKFLPPEFKQMVKEIHLYLRPGWLHGLGGGMKDG